MSSRQISKMLQQIATQDDVTVVSRMSSVKKLARLALIAEQFGFQYGDAAQTGAQNGSTAMLLHRDPSPAAQQRAAANMARFPQAGNGGDLPGMQPGGKLKPLPEAADHLELLKARINFDLTGKSAEKRMLAGAAGLTVMMVLGLVRDALQDDALVYGVIGYVLLMLLLGAGFLWTRQRNANFAARLEAAGFARVRDENGRSRYLPPGAQLPGHANPFGSGAPVPPQAYGAPPVGQQPVQGQQQGQGYFGAPSA
ncbi:hypothetical protein [Streptomyces daliensis]|uniref:Integral membrane protein n=1 Tax=Streptomyces daliensis TaxID=299421 RepID=A0A8T4IZQ7_9ACTN|nr:hypothetical protein [Streptomyces daliensis]